MSRHCGRGWGQERTCQGYGDGPSQQKHYEKAHVECRQHYRCPIQATIVGLVCAIDPIPARDSAQGCGSAIQTQVRMRVTGGSPAAQQRCQTPCYAACRSCIRCNSSSWLHHLLLCGSHTPAHITNALNKDMQTAAGHVWRLSRAPIIGACSGSPG